MKIIILGAAGFIGTNLTKHLLMLPNIKLTLVDNKKEYFVNYDMLKSDRINIVQCDFNIETDYNKLLCGHEIVFNLLSTTIPGNSNKNISFELSNNVSVAAKILDACVHEKIKKVIFTSSGGTVYGVNCICPIKEETITQPITTYGIQKVTIENMLYLYNYMYGLDYSVVRIANPYGPYQRPNGVLGAVTTFIYKAINEEQISVYGDGNIIRDYVYIDDVVNAILNVSFKPFDEKVVNIGSGYGRSIKEILEIIEQTLKIKLDVVYYPKRNVDIPINYLDITKYENKFGKLAKTSIEIGIVKTAKFLKENY